MISIKISLSVVVYFLLEGSFEKAVFYFYGKSKLKGSLLSDTHTIGSKEKNISEQKKLQKKHLNKSSADGRTKQLTSVIFIQCGFTTSGKRETV
jgi:hypothetical protein